ncbi:MAG: serine hydrolase domain-containing protein [Pseudomonadota bacterium]
MPNWITTTCTLFSCAALFACQTPRHRHSLPSSPSLDARIETLMTRDDVKGLAVAVIEGDEILHVRAYGARNVERGLPLENDTIMYGASLTKAAFGYMVLQLVDEGRLDLDRTIDRYLPKPLPEYPWWQSLQDDPEWRALTPRIILSHRTGLNNLRYFEPDQNLTFHFRPGASYAYSGEGINILQAVLEEGLGLDVKQEMRQRLFDPLDMPNTSLQWREDFADNLADGYAMDGSFEPHDERSFVSASGSMDTTIADQARLWRGLLSGEGLSPELRTEWVRPQFPIRTLQKFPTLPMRDTQTDRAEPIELAAGLGLMTWQGPTGRNFAKGGHNDWTGNLVICQETERRCLVMLANSVRAEIIFPEIAEFVLGETGYPWWWIYPALHNDRP